MKCHRVTGRHGDSVRISLHARAREFGQKACVGVCRCDTQFGAGRSVNIRPFLGSNRFYQPELNPVTAQTYAIPLVTSGSLDGREWC